MALGTLTMQQLPTVPLGPPSCGKALWSSALSMPPPQLPQVPSPSLAHGQLESDSEMGTRAGDTRWSRTRSELSRNVADGPRDREPGKHRARETPRRSVISPRKQDPECSLPGLPSSPAPPPHSLS